MGTVADKLGRLAQTKADIRAAIVEKGQAVEETEPFSAYGNKIRAISGGGSGPIGGTEVAVLAQNDILSGKLIYTIEGKYDPVIRGNGSGVGIGVAANSVSFSLDGKLLAIAGGSGKFLGYAKLYSVSETSITYLQDIPEIGNTASFGAVNVAEFSPDSSLLVVGGQFTGYAKLYSVSGNSITYLQDIPGDSNGTALNGSVAAASFSSDGSRLVLGGGFTGYAKLYSVSGNSITYLQDIPGDSNGTALNRAVNAAAFSPNNGLLILGGQFTDYAKEYLLAESGVEYLGPISGSGVYAIDSNVAAVSFSSDGTLLVMGGPFASRAIVYGVDGTTVSTKQVLKVGSNAMSTGLIRAAAFSPDNSLLVIGGTANLNKAILYTESNENFSYNKDVEGTTNATYAAAFSPDGSIMVLGGPFEFSALKYAVVDGIPTYVETATNSAYTTEDGNIPKALPANMSPIGVGYAESDIKAGAEGIVKVIATIE